VAGQESLLCEFVNLGSRRLFASLGKILGLAWLNFSQSYTGSAHLQLVHTVSLHPSLHFRPRFSIDLNFGLDLVFKCSTNASSKAPTGYQPKLVFYCSASSKRNARITFNLTFLPC